MPPFSNHFFFVELISTYICIMGYPNPFKTFSRNLTENIVITSGPFTRINTLNFGARMALLRFGEDIVVWSAIPYSEEVEKAITLLNGKGTITHLIIPDQEHTMAAKSFRAKYPGLKILAPDTVNLGPDTPIDYKVSAPSGNKVLSLANNLLSKELGIEPTSPLSNLEFVYLPTHANKELVVYDGKSKILFQADLIFNLGGKGPYEQYSPETGFAKGFNPFTGLSGLCSYMNPHSWFGRFMAKKALGGSEIAKQGLRAINSWDFEKMVMCHGNIWEKDAKEVYQELFKDELKQ